LSNPESPIPTLPSRPSRFGWLRPSHQHSATSATLLLSAFAFLSRIVGLVREKYIAFTFGAGPNTDAYNVAFQLPDLITSLLIGGAASISFITILSRYRESGREEEGDEALSVILNTMFLILGTVIVVVEFFVPLYTRLFFKDNPAQAALCTTMTRILLPGQLFFFAGGVLASVALVRKQFAYQAASPVVYNLIIILGGVLLSHAIGIPSLAFGALAGAFVGPFAVNAYAARRAGVHYRPILDFNNPGLRDWVRMSIPLMFGFTTVFMDGFILTWFAKHSSGDISRLMYAKRLFTAPMGIIGQAAGAASFPFFASLFSRKLFTDYASAVNRSVSRILAVALMFTSGIFALALPTVNLIYRGGSFSRADAASTAIYFGIFSLSLLFWAAQPLYARAFFAAGETRIPMFGGTIVMLLSLPVYWLLHRRFGVIGLAWASNLAILSQTVVLAVLAHRRALVPLFGLDYAELGRSLLAALVSFAGIELLLRILPHSHTQLNNLFTIAFGGIAWAALCVATLHLTGSSLPTQLRRK
jgi:putative peptidoglycan lipid II flippase